MKKLLLCMLVMLCCGICWGNTTSYYEPNYFTIKTATETYKCSLCPNATSYSYTYREGETRIEFYPIYADNFKVKSRAGYIGISLHKDDYSWICPKCLKQIIKALYKAGKE